MAVTEPMNDMPPLLPIRLVTKLVPWEYAEITAQMHAYAQSYADARVRELEKDAARIEWIEKMVREHAGVWFSPCGDELRFVQLRWHGLWDSEVENFPTVNGIRAAIDRAMERTK